MTPDALHKRAYTCVGIDRANGKDTAVIGICRDGVWTFEEVDPSNPSAFKGLQIDAVWVEEECLRESGL